MGSRRLIAGILLAVGVSGIVYGVNMLRKDCIDRVEKKLDVELRNHVSVKIASRIIPRLTYGTGMWPVSTEKTQILHSITCRMNWGVLSA